MPAFFGAGNNALNAVRNLASRGDIMATALMALMDNTYYASMVAGVEAANIIKIAGQIKDQDGNNVAGVKDILVTSKPIAGAGTLTDGGAGVVVAGSASVSLWYRTDATGAFQIDVTNVNVEQNLIMVSVDNGTTELLVLTFA